MWYNKYRPTTLAKVVSNDATKLDLAERSVSNTFPNVMMLVGESGTGKTTIAAIIAATLNCHAPVKTDEGLNPCGKCEACQDVFEGSFSRDVRFLDGSDLGKEAVENLRSEVVYDPMYDANNVVIIDEAQNITHSGLEATLRLLEVERKNTYFILCTMNPKAFNKAIRSRGQVYLFNKLSMQVIGERLIDIIETEDPDEALPEVLIEEGVTTIAENSEGSLRQAISMLERAVNSKLYDRESIEREFGLVGEKKTFAILLKLLNKDPDFFTYIGETDLKAFFYYAWKVVNETAVRSFNLDEHDPDDWKVKNSRKLLRFESFWQLLDMFKELQSVQSNYFNENAFLTMLIQFFRTDNEDSLPRLTQTEQPARRVKRTRKTA